MTHVDFWKNKKTIKQKFLIEGISVDFNTLETKKIKVEATSKSTCCNLDFSGLIKKFNNLTPYETHQEVIFLQNGRVVYIFDKNKTEVVDV